MSKFYEFKNETDISNDLYIYGAITSSKDDDWMASESDVDLNDFKETLDSLQSGTTLNIYVNSPGGSVFAASTMCSMLQRAKETKNIKIIAYVDGLAASAASFLIMVADEINMYSNSMLMVHKPMSIAWGNANDLQKEIDTLNSIENNVMLPLYEKKAKCDISTIKNLIEVESWLSAKEVDDLFNVNLLDSAKEVNACVDKNLFKCYKNVPDMFKEVKNEVEEEKTEEEPKEQVEETIEEHEVKEEPKQQEIVEKVQNIDYSYFENKLNSVKGER